MRYEKCLGDVEALVEAACVDVVLMGVAIVRRPRATWTRVL